MARSPGRAATIPCDDPLRHVNQRDREVAGAITRILEEHGSRFDPFRAFGAHCQQPTSTDVR